MKLSGALPFCVAMAVLACGACNTLLGIGPHEVATGDGATDASGPAADAGDVEEVHEHETEPDVTSGVPCAALVVDPHSGGAGWSVVAWALYLVPAADVQSALFSVWAPNHAYDSTYRVFKSARAHPAPYAGELSSGLEQAGLTSTGCVYRSAIVIDSDLILSIVLAASRSAPLALAADSPTVAVPVIEGPLTLTGSLFGSGSIVDTSFEQAFPEPASLYPGDPAAVGTTHVVADFDLLRFSPPKLDTMPGNYGFELDVTASRGGGTSKQSVYFTVR